MPEGTLSRFETAAETVSPPLAADLVERYADVVHNLSLRLTGNRDEALDLAQDAFVKILRGASSFRGEASVKTWICRVVVNCHRNRSRWWRRLKRGRAVSLDQPAAPGRDKEAPPPAETIPDPGPSPERLAAGRESAARLRAELARLPAGWRAVILLREVEEMSYAEIAVTLRVREGTVKSRLARAREALRRALSEPEPRATGAEAGAP